MVLVDIELLLFYCSINQDARYLLVPQLMPLTREGMQPCQKGGVGVWWITHSFRSVDLCRQCFVDCCDINYILHPLQPSKSPCVSNIVSPLTLIRWLIVEKIRLLTAELTFVAPFSWHSAQNEFRQRLPPSCVMGNFDWWGVINGPVFWAPPRVTLLSCHALWSCRHGKETTSCCLRW